MPFANAPKPPIKYFAIAMQDDKILQQMPAEPLRMAKRVCTTIYAVLTFGRLSLKTLFEKRNHGRRILAESANSNPRSPVWRLDVVVLQCNARPILTVWPRKHMWRGYTIVCQCRWTKAVIEIDVGPTAKHCFHPIFDVRPSIEESLCQMVARNYILTCLSPGCNGEVFGDSQMCQRCELAL